MSADGESLASRARGSDFISRVEEMVGSLVRVYLIDGRIIVGRLISIDPDYLNIIVEEVGSEETGENLTLIPGTSIGYIKFIKVKPPIEEKSIEEKILDLLEREPNLTVPEIARILNVEPSRVRSALRRLRRKGYIKSGDEKSSGKSKP